MVLLVGSMRATADVHCGLPNIGNSCYINSALQVMYRTDIIRNALLTPEVVQFINYEIQTATLSLETIDVDGSVYSDAVSKAAALSTQIDSRKKNISKCDYTSDTELQELIRQAEHFASIVSTINTARKRVAVSKLVSAMQELFTAFRRMEVSGCNATYLVYTMEQVRKNLVPLLGNMDNIHDTGETSEVLMKILEYFGDIAPLEGMYSQIVSDVVLFGSSTQVTTLILTPTDTEQIAVKDLVLNSEDTIENYAGILFMSVNRQKYADGKYIKLETPLIYPSVFSLVNDTYHLHSIVVHEGDGGGGHYYTVIKDLDSDKGNWVVYNDSSVSTISEVRALGDYRLLVTHFSYIRRRDFGVLTNRSWISSCIDIDVLENALNQGEADDQIKKRINVIQPKPQTPEQTPDSETPPDNNSPNSGSQMYLLTLVSLIFLIY